MTFKNASLAIFVLLLTFCANVFAQQDSAKTRYLQVSTNPSTVDLYTRTISPDFASRPDYVSPAFIPIPAGIGGRLVDISAKKASHVRRGDTLAWIEREAG